MLVESTRSRVANNSSADNKGVKPSVPLWEFLGINQFLCVPGCLDDRIYSNISCITWLFMNLNHRNLSKYFAYYVKSHYENIVLLN